MGLDSFLGIEPCPLHWPADSHPLHHQASPVLQLDTYSCLLPMVLVLVFFFLSPFNSQCVQTLIFLVQCVDHHALLV